MTTDLERDFAALAARLGASTVGIHSAGGRGSGSGVIWSADGRIVTNAHVARSRIVDVEFADGRRIAGTVEQRDERRDLAAIRVATHGLTPVLPRDPHDLRVGEIVVAFGHPLGVRNVLTTGILHAPHRTSGFAFVRADVRLAPGNSGGALADAQGRVIGINSMVAGSLALAVPADDVRRFMGEALPDGRLGVRLAPAQTADGRPAYAVIAVEPESAAERSGILIGDVLEIRNANRLAGAAHVDLRRGGVAVRVPIRRVPSESGAAA